PPTSLAPGAIPAGAEQGEVPDVGLESAVDRQPLDQLGGDRRLNLGDGPAPSAYQMNVVGFGGRVVRRRAVAEMRVAHQTELLQQLETPVHGREVDALRGLAHLGQDVVRGRMVETLNRLENQLALRRQAVAARPQVVAPVGGARRTHTVESRSPTRRHGRAGHGPCRASVAAATRFSSADRCGWSSCPIAAISYTYISRPSTRPYSRWPAR